MNDTGAGIPCDVLKRVFELFFTMKAVGKGTGLSQVFGFAKQSGGDIAVESAGRGHDVHSLPAADRAARRS